MFLSIIDVGLAPAHPYTPEGEISCLAAITNTLCYCCTNWSGCSYFFPGSLLEKSELFKDVKKTLGRKPPIYLQRTGTGRALFPTLHLQNAATKTYRWPTDGLNLCSSSVFAFFFAARITESWNYRVWTGPGDHLVQPYETNGTSTKNGYGLGPLCQIRWCLTSYLV